MREKTDFKLKSPNGEIIIKLKTLSQMRRVNLCLTTVF